MVRVLLSSLLVPSLLAAGLVAGGPVPAAPVGAGVTPVLDTLLSVRPGDRLVVDGLEGFLRVEGTPGERLEVIASDHPVRLERRGEVIHLRATRPGRGGEIELRAPGWMPLEIRGRALAVEVDGMTGGMDLEVLSGDVDLEGLAGGIRVSALDGTIRAERLRGALVATTLDGDIEVRDVEGRVGVETTDGNLILARITGPEIRATSVDGDIDFDGEIPRGGTVVLSTHDGDVTLRTTEPDAAFDVTTWDGNFESDFRVRVHGVASRDGLRFTLGGGAARVSIRTFDGDIRLLRR